MNTPPATLPARYPSIHTPGYAAPPGAMHLPPGDVARVCSCSADADGGAPQCQRQAGGPHPADPHGNRGAALPVGPHQRALPADLQRRHARVPPAPAPAPLSCGPSGCCFPARAATAAEDCSSRAPAFPLPLPDPSHTHHSLHRVPSCAHPDSGPVRPQVPTRARRLRARRLRQRRHSPRGAPRNSPRAAPKSRAATPRWGYSWGMGTGRVGARGGMPPPQPRARRAPRLRAPTRSLGARRAARGSARGCGSTG